MPRKIYISGRIKDYPEYKAHFEREAHKLRVRDGYEIVNPCELGEPTFTYEQFMRCDLAALLECDEIYMLEGWEKSAGARCEHLVAALSGLTIRYERAG